MTAHAHDLPWDEQQREWLQALGHDVLVLAAAAGPEAAPVASTPRVEAKAAAPALLRALAQAARREADDAELQRALPDLATLRSNPAARRALWPQLRALRKAGRT